MKFQGAAIASIVSMSLTGLAASAAMAQELPQSSFELRGVAGELQEAAGNKPAQRSIGVYIVQLKGKSGVEYHNSLPENNNRDAVVSIQQAGNTYNAKSPAMQAYTAEMQQRQNAVLSDIGVTETLHSYLHTFNGFSAKLSARQANALRNHPDVANVWEDEKLELTTANTPEFLGLTGPNGQHTLGVKGEGVVVGIVDSGISPDNPSFADDGTFTVPADWNGECNVGTIGPGDDVVPGDEAFTCSNKLIGARYFGAGFSATYDIQFELGEFNSARDADGHGSHTAGTAAGNEVANATLQGTEIGGLSGVAPRANVAAYKVCWNSDYVSPEGVDERGCFGSDSAAAIDAAVADGVDVINYSISGSRTSVIAPQTLAMMRAAEAGVFVSVSAGNSGAGPGVVGTPAPWVMSVAASTYDGERPVISDAIVPTVDGIEGEAVLATQASFTPRLEVGFNGSLEATDDVTACAPLDQDLTGNVALISRGACSFTAKIWNAQQAGATGVVVYTDDRPITTMGATPADGGEILIPAAMISREEGLELSNASLELPVEVAYNGTVATTVTEVGNVMAGFSSRGGNDAVADIIKPDITGPGVNVLASTTPAPLAFPGNNPLFGEDYAYLSGTSMSAPHLAGMAALLTEQNPTWTAMQKKSALMTTAYQGVTNADGSQAQPFDFGSGHADVLAARTPGFTYNASLNDWGAYLCGRDRESVVIEETGFNCAAFENAGFSFDATQLNYPSMAIGELVTSEVVVRVVTDVTGEENTYDAVIEAPEGTIATLVTIDAEGNPVFGGPLTVPANGQVAYGVLIETTPEAVLEEWRFGSITFTSGDIVNRSPIGVRAFAEPKITVPARVTVELDRRNNARFPVEYLYSGSTQVDGVGLVTPFGSAGSVTQDPDQSFAFFEPGLGQHRIPVTPDSTLARFSMFDSLVDIEGADLDLIVYRCIDFSCSFITDSLNVGSNENVEFVNPIPASGDNGRSFYLLWVHGFDLGAEEIDPEALLTTDYTLVYWVANGESTVPRSRISGSRRAIEGKFNNIRVAGGRAPLPFFSYMGTATFTDDEGVNQGTTVIEAIPQANEE